MPQILTKRISSLDILRGFTMFMLVFFQPVLEKAAFTFPDIGWLQSIYYQFSHAQWTGLRAWDMIMPLFLFMSGTSLPFSFAKYENRPKKELYIKILRRFVILFILGMIVQGNLLGLDLKHFTPYSNTLQTIAVGYVVTSIIVLNLPLRWQIISAVALLVIYWIPMTFAGDWTPDGNFAEMIDRAALGRFRDGIYWTEDGAWHFSETYRYTWIWSSLNFSVTVMLGYFAGLIVKKAEKVSARLVLIGCGLIAISLLWSLQMPIIKIIWTSTMTLFTGGICFVLLGIFHFIADERNCHKYLDWLKIYGMNAIAAYVLGESIRFTSIVQSVSYGLEQYLGKGYGIWLVFGNFTIVFLILYLMYKNKIFIKI